MNIIFYNEFANEKPKWDLQFENALKGGDLDGLRDNMQANLDTLNNVQIVGIKNIEKFDWKFGIKLLKARYLINRIDNYNP